MAESENSPVAGSGGSGGVSATEPPKNVQKGQLERLPGVLEGVRRQKVGFPEVFRAVKQLWHRFPMGTRSVIYGYHCQLIHPIVVLVAWVKLYGWPNCQTLVAIFVHDLGYWGRPKMDDENGELHPILGALIMNALFDHKTICPTCRRGARVDCWGYWGRFALFHSRAFAKKHGEHHSKLCVADKYAIAICPIWLQLGLMNATGEIKEYMLGQHGRTVGDGNQREWVQRMHKVVTSFVEENRAETSE